MSTEAETRAALYAQREREWAQRADSLRTRSRALGNARGVAFLTGVAGGFGLAARVTPLASTLALTLGLSAFFALVIYHARVAMRERTARLWSDVNRDALARVRGEWDQAGLDTGEDLVETDHPYADDLDLFGPGSLFQRLSTAHSPEGRERLAQWLCSPTTTQELSRRQALVEALAPQLDWRQGLEVQALLAFPRKGGVPKDAEATKLMGNWTAAAPWRVSYGSWLLQLALTLSSLAVATAFSLGVPLKAWAALPLLGALAWSMRGAIATHPSLRVLDAASLLLTRLEPLAVHLEAASQKSPELSRLVRDGLPRGNSPTRGLRKLRVLSAWLEVRSNPLLRPLLNALLCWDCLSVWLLETWRARWGDQVSAWLIAVGEAEALSSLAGLHADEPRSCLPQVVTSEALRFEATDLGHPLLAEERRVGNDVALGGGLRALVITGSNMSGKSTLLRSIGTAAVLAQAGGPVCAASLTMSPLRVRTSLQVRDSVRGGTSRFFAELHKLREVVADARKDAAVLFLLDEVLHGTNSRERVIGARWLAQTLLEAGSIGAISTHDLELCRLQGSLADLVQTVHFCEEAREGKLVFDFKLRPGPVREGNALRLMRQLGLAVPEEPTPPG